MFCRVGKVTIPTVCYDSCPPLGKFTLLTLYSSFLHLLLSFGFPFYFCLLIFIYTPFTLSSGLRASFPREVAIPAFRSLCRSPPSYKSLRYKTIFFIVQVFADGALFCVSSEVLASQQNCCHCLEKSRLFIYMSCPFVSDSVRSSSHDSSLQKCSKKLMKKHQFQKISILKKMTFSVWRSGSSYLNWLLTF